MAKAPMTVTKTTTTTSTQTAVVVAVVAATALGLAAIGYGYGFATIQRSSLSKPRATNVLSQPSQQTITQIAPIVPKVKPMVTKLALSSVTLANVDQDLVKLQVSPDSQAYPIAVKQMVFSLSMTGGLKLSNFRFRRGAVDMSLSDYAITFVAPGPYGQVATDAQNGVVTSTSGFLVVSFAQSQEETLVGSGYVYTLHATVSGAKAGESVTLALFKGATPQANGYLTVGHVKGNTLPPAPSIYQINDVQPPQASLSYPVLQGYFVWSDISAIPHSSALGLSSGSSDWFNDADLAAASQTLSL